MISPYDYSATSLSNNLPEIYGNDHLVTGLFPNREKAEQAYSAALARGVKNDEISIVMSDATRKQCFLDQHGTSYSELSEKATSTNKVGQAGLIGGTIGALAAAIAAVGTSIILPGLGLVIAGPIAAAFAGAGAGAVAGGLVGALIDWELPENVMKEYENGIQRGHILLGARTDSAEKALLLKEDWKKYESLTIHPIETTDIV